MRPYCKPVDRRVVEWRNALGSCDICGHDQPNRVVQIAVDYRQPRELGKDTFASIIEGDHRVHATAQVDVIARTETCQADAVRIDQVTAEWVGDRTRESFHMGWENGGWTADGTIEGPNIQYVVRLDPRWRHRQFMLFRDDEAPDLWLGHDGQKWGEVNGAQRPDLSGCSSLVLVDAPFTWGAVARRLELSGGDHERALVGVVDIETLQIEPTVFEFRRESPTAWSIDGLICELDVDGLILDYGEFRRGR